MAAKKKQPDLETSLKELEQLVESMESGDLSLDEAMKKFERGIELTRFCQNALKEAEQKVDLLMKNSNTDSDTVPFE